MLPDRSDMKYRSEYNGWCNGEIHELWVGGGPGESEPFFWVDLGKFDVGI